MIKKAFKSVFIVTIVMIIFMFVDCKYDLNISKIDSLSAAALPVKIERLNNNSKILIVGDSRMRDICYSINKDDSCLTYGGGRYYPYQVDQNRKINSKEYQDLAKKTIDEVVHKYGTINVFVVATINDYWYGQDIAKKGALEMLSFANSLKEHNERARVYVCSLIKTETGTTADYYNDFVKEQIKTKYNNLQYLDITPDSINYSDGVHFKENTSADINNKFKKVATSDKCKIELTNKKISQSNNQKSSSKYRLTCNQQRSIKGIKINNGANISNPAINNKVLTGDITNLNQNRNYEIEITDSLGYYYSYKFSPVDELFLDSLPAGKCPVAPSINGVLVNGSSTEYDTKRVKYIINTSNLSEKEIKNLYLVYKAYKKDNITFYNINGNPKAEKIGTWYTGYVIPVTALSKDGDKYKKDIAFNNYYYTALYSGSKLCYFKFIVEDGYEMNNNFRRYKLSTLSITTKKGLINGYSSSIRITSSDKKVFDSYGADAISCKATSMSAKNGTGNNKTSTITMTKKNLKGTFKLKIPDRYWETGYLLNPVTGKNTPLAKTKKMTRTSNTIQSDGKKSYGVEIFKKEGSKVYAMDSGTVKVVSNGNSHKHNYGKYIQIQSRINGEEYIHSYAHLKDVKVNVNDRVYKGQIIGTVGKEGYKNKPLKEPLLFVSITHTGKKYSEALLLNNFVGRNLSYVNVTSKNYSDFQKYIDDKRIPDYNKYCTNNKK